jgi:hypothetical protein
VDSNYFTNHAAGLAPITGLQAGGAAGANGVYGYGSTSAFPSQSYQNSNYWVDAVFLDTTSTTPPAVTATTPSSTPPSSSTTGVRIDTALNASFSEGIDPSTLNFTVTDQGGNAVPGSASYDQSGHVATFQPNGELGMSTTYTASVLATDLWGNTMAAPYTWTFTTASTPPNFNCPCSLWSGKATPAVASTYDTNAVEVGTVFQSAVAGEITGLSFYKGAQNTGTHTGSLWSASGAQLASGTFTGETASGWQSLTFSSPVAIAANTPYVVSYHAPNGFYASTPGYFNGAVSTYPLTALASTAAAHGNGVYTYGSASTLPTSTFNATNYWVDPTFALSPPAASPVSAHAPASGASASQHSDPDDAATAPPLSNTVVGNVQPIMARFPEPVQPQSLRITVTTTVAALGSESPANTAVAGTLIYDQNTNTAEFRPATALQVGAVYNAVATAKDADGNAVAPIQWSFTVASNQSAAPPAQRSPLGGRIPQTAPLAPEVEERIAG